MNENRDQLSGKLNADSREVRWSTADPPYFLRSVSTASTFGRMFVFFMVRHKKRHFSRSLIKNSTTHFPFSSSPVHMYLGANLENR